MGIFVYGYGVNCEGYFFSLMSTIPFAQVEGNPGLFLLGSSDPHDKEGLPGRRRPSCVAKPSWQSYQQPLSYAE